MNLFDYPDDDSEDLTDAEIERATPTRSVLDLGEKTAGLLHLLCHSCGTPLTLTNNAVRRRKPDLFSRATLTCQNDHETSYTFKVNWLENRT